MFKHGFSVQGVDTRKVEKEITEAAQKNHYKCMKICIFPFFWVKLHSKLPKRAQLMVWAPDFHI